MVMFMNCSHKTKVWETLDKAEVLMNSFPDSALTILYSIDKRNLGDSEEKARYALLMSIALDKNNIDTTSFEVLKPAIDYYLGRGSADERLRTLYYQGRIYQNRGDNDSAMLSFLNACDLRQMVKDTLVLARTLVAQATLYLIQYKITEFINNNLDAAKLYGAVDRNLLEIKSYSNAIDGFVMLNDKVAADSLIAICKSLVKKNPEGDIYLRPTILSYTVHLRSPMEISDVLSKYQYIEPSTDEAMIVAQAYSKIGEYDKALSLISGINPAESTWDSLKYASVKIDILEKQGLYKQALSEFRNYSAIREINQKRLLSQDLLFSDKKHELEVKRLMDIRKKDRIIGLALFCLFLLFIIIGLLYFRNNISRAKRILAEKENENLRLEQDNLRKEIEKAELERDKQTLEKENLEKDKKRLEAEQRQHELEASNLRLEIRQLETERDNLKDLQKQQSDLAIPIRSVIKKRLKLLNGLLAKEITNNESYAEPYNKWIETVHNDKKQFMDSTRLAFAASNPKFMAYLEEHELSIDEINYLCLYAIGLRGKEVGEYIQLKRHYVISHEIRKKLGIDEHETNIGIYIRRLMNEFEK